MMKMRRMRVQGEKPFSRKGYIYTLEVLLAVSLILITLTFLFKTPPVKPNLEVSTQKLQAFQALEYLENKGDLRKFVIVANETDIESRINDTISSSIGFEIDICTLSCNNTDVPGNKTVVSVDYYIAGYKNVHDVSKIKMWTWRK